MNDVWFRMVEVGVDNTALARLELDCCFSKAPEIFLRIKRQGYKSHCFTLFTSRLITSLENGSRHIHRLHGITVDLNIVQSEVARLADRFLRNKTLDQLRLIEAIPSMTVTPALMKACGFVRQQTQNETAVIYVKFVVGKADTLDKMSRYGHNGSRIYAKSSRQS